MMNAVLIRRLAIARIGFGLVALSTPAGSARPFVGRADASRPWSKLLARMTGVREIALGLVVLRSLRTEDNNAQAFVVGVSAACDLVDGLSALADRSLPARLRWTFSAAALPFAGIEASAALRSARGAGSGASSFGRPLPD
ncbi:MAG: DUF4267 domain-containing protein [Acidimicrobiales bacterium]